MHPLPARVPVCLVTGASGPAKRDFIRALAAARPADERWAVLDNDAGNSARDLANARLAVAASIGCACCTGQVALLTGIVRLIRQSRPQRLIVAADGAAEPAALERALRQTPLARGIVVTHRLCVAAPQSPDAMPQSAPELLRRQMAAADHVVCGNAAAGAALSTACGAQHAISVAEAIRLVLASPALAA